MHMNDLSELKKKRTSAVSASSLAILLGIVFSMLQWTSCSETTSKPFSQFEPFSLERESQLIELPNDLPVGEWKGLLVVKFDSDCHLCRDKMLAMQRESKMLNDFVIVLVSSEDWGNIESFERQFGLSEKQNYIVGRTDEESFYGRFNAVGAPFTAVFDKRGVEVYRFDGNPSLHPILNAYFKLEE